MGVVLKAPAEARRREENMEGVHGMHGERTALTAQVLRGLGLRTRATWPDAAGPTESSVPHKLGPPLSGGPRVTGGDGFEQRYPPPDHVRALDRGGWWPRRGAALPLLLTSGEAQDGCRHSPPTLHPPATSHQPQRPPPGHPMDLVHLARATAGNLITTTTPGAAMPLFKRPAEGQAMAPSCSSSELDRVAAASRYAGTGGGGGNGEYGRVPDYRYRPEASPTQPQWNSYMRGGPSLSGDHAPWAAGLIAARDRRSLGSADGGVRGGSRSSGQQDAEGGNRDVPLAGWLLQSPPGERSLHQYPLMPTPTSTKRMRLTGGGDGGGGVAGSIDRISAPGPGQGPGPAADLNRGYQHGATPSWAATPPSSAGGRGWCRRTGSLPSTASAPRQGGRGGDGRASVSAGATTERGSVAIDASFFFIGVRDPTRASHTAPSSSSSVAAAAAADAAGAEIAPGPRPSWNRGSGGRSVAAAVADPAGAETAPGPRPSWNWGSGGRSVGEATTSQAGRDGHASLGFGRGQWSGTGDRSGGAGAYAGFHRGREFFYQAREQHRTSPLLDRHHQGQDQHSQQRAEFLPADTALAPTRLLRGGSDPGAYNAALPALHTSRVSESVPPPHRLLGLEGAVATVEPDQSAGGGARLIFGESAAGAFDVAGGGGVRGGAATGDADVVAGERSPEQQRQVEDAPTQPLVPMGCAEAGCDRRLRFALKGNKKPAYCARHRTAGMVDTRHPQCQDRQCARQPSFGMEGDRRASYCARHKKEGMINVLARRCQQTGCFRHPNFGFPGDRRSSFCKQHREAGMEDIVSRRCKAPSCTRRRLYNLKGLPPVSCSRHKLPGMIDVVSTRCQAPGCMSHPSFGYVSDMKARRCAKHRQENMEGVKGHRQKGPREATRAGAAAAAAAGAAVTTDTASHPSSPSLASSSPSSVRSSSLASAAEETTSGHQAFCKPRFGSEVAV